MRTGSAAGTKLNKHTHTHTHNIHVVVYTHNKFRWSVVSCLRRCCR